jgi:hypothetical protein
MLAHVGRCFRLHFGYPWQHSPTRNRAAEWDKASDQERRRQRDLVVRGLYQQDIHQPKRNRLAYIAGDYQEAEGDRTKHPGRLTLIRLPSG